jgi:hypothetical protein
MDSVEDLKQLVSQTLHSSGVLGKFKVRAITNVVTYLQAQLRASVFDVLQKNDTSDVYMKNPKVTQIHHTPTSTYFVLSM